VIVIDKEKQPYLLDLLEKWSDREVYCDTSIISSEKEEIINKILDDGYGEDLTDKLEMVTSGGKFVAVFLELSYHDNIIRHYIDQDGVKFMKIE
jgi:hypothetical protein